MSYRGVRAGPAESRTLRILAAAGALILIGLWRADSVVAQAPAAPPAARRGDLVRRPQAVLRHLSQRTAEERRPGHRPGGVTNVGAGADRWEKVVRKLRTQTMPPPGAPRPDAASYDRVATFLETELDRAEAARPHLGKLPLTHRLSRTEYRNAVRDLLALESLPREVSIDYLLPPDNISSGFDNIADLLFVSPSNMERYLDAARKISRLAVGDPAMPVMVNIHRAGSGASAGRAR